MHYVDSAEVKVSAFKKSKKSDLELCGDSIVKTRNVQSHVLDNSFHTTPKTNRFYDLNRGLVLGLRMVGRGYSAAQKHLSILKCYYDQIVEYLLFAVDW